MESMYKEVAKAIEEEGVEKSPTDYLKFFCLGKRESPEVLETEGLELEDPPADTVVEKVRNRFDYSVTNSVLVALYPSYFTISVCPQQVTST